MTTLATRPKSEAIFDQLTKHLPGGVNSPVRCFPGLQCTPLVAESAKGAEVVDPDGNSYIDYCCSWGALPLGHADEAVLDVVGQRMRRGTSFGITTEIEGRLAEKISEHVPSMELLRFVSSGTEATMSALRLARGCTGRDLFVKFNGNYHGHADPFLVAAGSGVADLPESSSSGVPKDAVKHTISLPYNDVGAVEHLFRERGNEVAAIIVEPIAGNMGVVPGSRDFLATLRRVTKEHGALLIFDEVISGFRVALGGAQSLYGITPDLTTLGKVIGGGFPVAAFGGRRDLMEKLAPLGSVYQAGTLSGNPVAMEAGYQTILRLEQPGFYDELERKSALLFDGLNISDTCLQRVGSMATLFFGVSEVRSMEEAQQQDVPRSRNFFRSLFDQGIYIPPSCFEAWFVSIAHSDEQLAYTRKILTSVVA